MSCSIRLIGERRSGEIHWKRWVRSTAPCPELSSGTTLASASSTEKALKDAKARGNNIAGAKTLGKTIAERLIDKGIKQVVFDRGGFLYHGRIKAVAEAAREAGLEF